MAVVECVGGHQIVTLGRAGAAMRVSGWCWKAGQPWSRAQAAASLGICMLHLSNVPLEMCFKCRVKHIRAEMISLLVDQQRIHQQLLWWLITCVSNWQEKKWLRVTLYIYILVYYYIWLLGGFESHVACSHCVCVCVWVVSGDSGFLPQSKDMQTGLRMIGDLKSTVSVNGCLSLCVGPGICWRPAGCTVWGLK